MTSETSSLDPTSFSPGLVIDLGDLTELSALEDIIAPQVDPEFNLRVWQGREPLKELIRPKVNGRTFNGRIADISLTVMEDPYDQLQTIKQRGLMSIGRTANFSREEEINRRNYVGLSLSAVLKSSGRGNIGTMSTELYYAPIPWILPRNGDEYVVRKGKKDEETREYKPTRNIKSQAICRFIMVPMFNKDAILAADSSAKRVGFKVLQDSMRRPISTPMRD